MNPLLMPLADQIYADRKQRLASRAPNGGGTPFPDADAHTTFATQKDRITMNPWFLDTSMQLYLAEMKHEDMLRNSLLHQQLRDAKTSPSFAFKVRFTLANALFSLGHVVKPGARPDEWTGTTPHTAA